MPMATVRYNACVMSTNRERSVPGEVAVFPLPNTVFFPDTVLPLHVFEPRYRAMVRDAIRGERRIAVSLLLPGWESEYAGSPKFHDVATVGRMEDIEELSDGRFDLRLVGVARVRLGRWVREKPYRIAVCRPLEELAPPEDDPRVLGAKLDLLASFSALARELRGPEASGVVVHDSVPFAAAVNLACATLPLEPPQRQRLLEIDDLLERQRKVTGLLDGLIEGLARLRASRGDGSPLN